MDKMTVEQRIQREHVWLMRNKTYCLYSGIIMLGKTEVVDDVPTACTNGRDVMYGREYMGERSDKEMRFVILHENLHKAFQHLTVWRSLYEEDAQLANMACDYVINLMIYDTDPAGQHVVMPKGGLLDERFRGMDAGTVFRLLKQEQGEGKGEGKGEGNGGFDHHDWEGAGKLSAEEEGQLARDVDRALRQGKMLAGKMGGDVPREINAALTPKVDWRSALREFITSHCQDKDESTWRRPNRRWIAQDVYMPSLIGESLGRILVGVDTSGSISGSDIAQALGEIKAICESVRPEGIDLVYWDAQVCRHEKYGQDQLDGLLSSTKPVGGGGTSPSCVTKFMSDNRIKPECVVMITDGYVGDDWGGEWPCPVLWGITTDRTAPVGKTVRIN